MSLGDERGYRDTGGHPDDGHGGFGGTGQTRTRLPGPTDPDGHGPRGGRPRPSRPVIGFVAVIVLLFAAIVLVNRGGEEDKGPGGSAAGPRPESTAASGVKPVTGKTGSIPTGYARDTQGAQSAAANYVVALGSDGMYDKEQRDRIVATVYAPAVVKARQEALGRIYSGRDFLAGVGLRPDGTAPSGMTMVTRYNPLGAKVERFGQNAATVSVWYSALFGLAGENSKNPVTQSWHTNTLQLTWVGGDWKVADFTQKDGPVPVGRDQTASGAEEMAEAVEKFGGFTYAR
ncbi:hypothetical protein ACFVIM_27065 [Streptomyces sp. NPDC057638]|uniref:hypothetical protein n=1 Tax=Streptomyces sp. NPDC057638 TaxID=3346190 RepID=UPI0036C506E1